MNTQKHTVKSKIVFFIGLSPFATSEQQVVFLELPPFF